ncbi:MAG: FprA family A-type flavoprotein [Bacilli bacterium]|jgi:flavorubredoxin
MHCTREIGDGLFYVGGSDRRLDLFENLLPLEKGVSYNSYLLLDEKTCLMDTIDTSLTRTFLDNVEYVLNGRKLDYLVVHHMEPDHAYNLTQVLLRHPETKVVGNLKTFGFIHNFFPELNIEDKKIVVKEGDVLSLGKHQLHFYLTPMVHWPEVMMSFDTTSGWLFTADAFGTFGALNGNLFADQSDYEKEYLAESRRYYCNIVGKYGLQVQMAFKKLLSLPIKMLLPLHGPVFRISKDISFILDKYQKWSTYTPEDKGVIIVYGSMYGDTETAADILANKLSEKGVKGIEVYDASKTPSSVLVGEAFRVSNIVIMSPTYNATIYPAIDEFITDFLRMGLQKRTFTLIQNGSWVPQALNLIKAKLATGHSYCYTPTEITITSALNEETLKKLDDVASEIVESLASK